MKKLNINSLAVIVLSLLLIISLWFNIKLLNKKPEILLVPYNPYHLNIQNTYSIQQCKLNNL